MEARGIFIQSNTKQLLGAKVAKFALETYGKAQEHNIPVTIMLVEDIPLYMEYVGIEYMRGTTLQKHNPEDLQFFTLSRFFPPSLMNYQGRALVIDPDIFALSSILPLFEMPMTHPIAACRKKDAWDSSVLVLENKELPHWQPTQLFEGLKNHTEDYTKWITLQNEAVMELPRIYNNLDTLTDDTVLLHTTKRLTQPWRTGLPIDFTRATPPHLFGIIPRIPLLKLRGKWPSTYQKHPDKKIEQQVLRLLQEAYQAGALTEEDITSALETNNLRRDIRNYLKTPTS